MLYLLNTLTNAPVLMDGDTAVGGILAITGQILASLTTWASDITGWIIADSMAKIFLGIMFLMLGLHFVKSFIKTA